MTAPVPLQRLGTSGLLVSRLALGTMTFGDRTDEAEAGRIWGEALEAGVTLIDTADIYAGGASEEIVGRLMRGRRDGLVIATKVGNPAGPSPLERGLSRRWLLQGVEASLRRLGTDHVDLLYLHKEDRETRPEETVRALADLQRSGKVRYFGLSNFRAWRVARLCALCDAEGIDRPVASQPLYHALNRAAEVEDLPVAAAHGMGVVSYSPTARGVLTGKYRPGEPPEAGSRAALGNRRILQMEYHPENLVAAEAVVRHARGRGVDPVAFAIAWVLANPLVSATIAGPRTLEQWRGYRAALDVAITAEDEAAVDAIVQPGTTAIPQHIDPLSPPEGRPVARPSH